MLSSTETALPSPKAAELYFDPPTFDSSSSTIAAPVRRSLRRHKNLPHPRTSNPPPAEPPIVVFTAAPAVAPPDDDPKIPWSEPSSQPSSPSQSRRTGGPDLPPTPPGHSSHPATSPATQSAQLPSPAAARSGSPGQSLSSPSTARIPRTPPNQRSPPTPDVTPPQQARRLKPFRPLLSDRVPSKATTDSRTASFKTAREDPYSSDEDRRSTLRPALASERDSQSTIRQASSESKQQKEPKSVGLGLGLESDDNLTPNTKQEFGTFDGDWGSTADSASEVEQEWDDNLDRNVTVRKTRAQTNMDRGNARQYRMPEVLEEVTISPTNATKILRTMSLHENPRVQSLSREVLERRTLRNASSTSEPAIATDHRRHSGMSSKSAVSTVVEAILVDTPPPKQRTLRHVKKHTSLRDAHPPPSASSSGTSSIIAPPLRRYKTRIGDDGLRPESYSSSATASSVADGKARREVWRSGGIPVVVIPERSTSMRTPTLRSTSSRRTQRSISLGPPPQSNQLRGDLTASYDRPPQRGRAMSLSDGEYPFDELTIDYPPVVPRRTSSLSASTSRNNSRGNSRSNSRSNSCEPSLVGSGSGSGTGSGSRSASLTTESLRLHNAMQEQQARNRVPQVTVRHVPSIPEVEYIAAEYDHSDSRHLQPVASMESHKDGFDHDHRLHVDHNGDLWLGKRLTSHNTPFSQASIDTNGTHLSAAEVSEALAVSIYPHQNKSVVIVDHPRKSWPADTLQDEQPPATAATTATNQEPTAAVDKPSITTTGPDGEAVTPPQPQLSLEDVDSPLRNPRRPPEPPAIKLTPATPSGLTPATDKMKMLGNYFEATGQEKRPSLVRRAFSLRRSSEGGGRESGFLSRTLSLSRTLRKDTVENPGLDHEQDPNRIQYPSADDPPPEEDRLHPFWRPASPTSEPEDDEDWVYDVTHETEPTDHFDPESDMRDMRPMAPRRSLSERMKHTFAILPINSDEHYVSAGTRAPERRTIRRTTSGNLRVVRQHDSYSSLRWSSRPSSSSRSRSHGPPGEGRPSTAPDSRRGRQAWGVEKHVDSRGRRFFPGWQEKFSHYGLQNLQRHLSERRRQKRSDELRQKISGPREVRDGVGEVVKRNSYRGPSYQSNDNNNTGRQAQNVEHAPRVQVQV